MTSKPRNRLLRLVLGGLGESFAEFVQGFLLFVVTPTIIALVIGWIAIGPGYALLGAAVVCGVCFALWRIYHEIF